jgi:hypothetical protein
MRIEMKTTRVIVNQEGRISDGAGLDVPVRFDLIGTQDFEDGVPGVEFSFGDLRFGDEARHRIASLAISRKPLILVGGGVQATIVLNGPDAFTAMSAVLEVRMAVELIAA